MNRISPRDTRSSQREEDWRDSAACRETDPEIFFASSLTGEGKADIRHAKVICFACPVMQECGQWALDSREPFGVYGGMTQEERRAILRRRGIRVDLDDGSQERKPAPKKREPAKCGTRSGYLRHTKDKTKICAPCRKANADADNRLRRTGTSKVAA